MSLPRAPSSLREVFRSSRVVLGSSSKWRATVLSEAGCVIAGQVAPEVDERSIRGDTPESTCMAVAQAKTDAVIHLLKGMDYDYAICSDQVNVCCDEMREKPLTREEAIRFIQSYSAGNPVSCLNAVIVLDLRTGRRAAGWDSVMVSFDHIPPELIEGELTDPATSPLYTCSGSFSCWWPPMAKYVRNIEGGGLDSVMGTPLKLIEELFEQLSSDV
jgi:predicted house-cleaning NTP pyrophosphatase (Maf/HAM1 superfamily)